MISKHPLLPILLFLLASFCYAQTYYVDPLGTDNILTHGTSSGAGALQTIQYAVTNVPAGSTINVAAGTYSEHIIINQPVTLLGPNNLISPVTGVRVSEAIINGTGADCSVDIQTGAEPITIQGFEFTGNNNYSAIFVHSNQVTISKNWFNAIQGMAVQQNVSFTDINSSQLVDDNKINNITGAGNSAIYFDYISNSTISNNYINTTPYAAIQLTTNSNNVTISANSISNIPQQGIQIAGIASGIIINGNTINNANTSNSANKGGIRLYGSSFTGTVTITNNSVSNSYNGLAIASGQDITGKDIHINNNNFSNNSNAGVYNATGTGPLDATNNYWGNASGPSHSSNTFTKINTVGQVAVTNNVTFVPWLDAAGGLSFAPIINNDAPAEKYSNFSDAVAGTLAGNTITTAAGIFTESFIVNKTVAIISQAGSYDVAIGSQTKFTGNSQFQITASDVNIRGFVFDGTTSTVNPIYLNSPGNNVNIQYNKFTNYTNRQAIDASSGSGSSGLYIHHNFFDQITGATGYAINLGNMLNVFVQDNIISNIGYQGITLLSMSNVTIQNNIISDISATGQSAISFNTSTGSINANTITNGSILLFASTLTVGTVNIFQNVIANSTGPNNGKAILTDGTNLGGAEVYINNNNFAGSTYGIYHTGTGTINGLNNWWGNASGPSHSSNTYTAVNHVGQVAVSNNVSFVPWWNPITTSTPAGSLAGTSFSPLTNNDLPPEYYSNFNDAIVGTPSGGSLSIQAGSFTESISIDKTITLTGSGAGSSFTSITLTRGAVVSASTLVSSPIININQTGAGTLPLINDALLLSASGGTINIATGAYPQDVTMSKSVTLNGTGSPTVNKFILTLGAVLGGAGSAGILAPVIDVNQTGVGVVPRLNDAVRLCSSGGVINVTGNTSQYLHVNINKSLTLSALYADGVKISNASPAITVSSSPVTISGFTFNFAGAIDYAVDVQAGNYNVTINECDFLTTLGVINRGTGIVTAHHNYWNSPNGPTVASSDCGSGSIVNNASSGTLIYSPWYVDNLPHTLLLDIPTLVFPASQQAAVTVTPDFSWTFPVGSGVPTYTIQIATDPNFTANVYGPVPTLNGGLDTHYQLPDEFALDNGTIFYWKIKAYVASGISCTSGQFISITAANPTLLSPVNNSIISGNIIGFKWTIPNGSVKYKLELAKDNAFTTGVGGSMISSFPTGLLTTNYFNLPFTLATLPSQAYYWRVKTYSDEGKLIYITPIYTFTVYGPPTAIAAYPINNQTVYTNSPQVYWYLNNYYYNSAVYCKVRYATVSGGPYNTNSALTTGQYVTLPGLNVGSTYYYVIDTSTTPTFDSYTTSSEASFNVFYSSSTLDAIPVFLSYPTGGATVYSTNPKLYWFLGLQIPSVAYDVDYAVYPGGFGAVEFTGVSGNEKALIGLTPGTTYQWRIKLSGPSATWYGPETFTVHSSATASSSSGPVIPTPTWPVAGNVVSTQSPTLTWSAFSTLPLDYQVIWSTSPLLTSGVLTPAGSSSWLVTTSHNLLGLTPGVTYYWQVRSRLSSSPATLSNYSSVGQFTVAAGASPVVVLPANPIVGSTINSTAANLSWIVPAKSTSLLKYDLEISKNKNFSNSKIINDLQEPSYQANNLDANSMYFWRVKSKTLTGISSSYSYSGQFNTGGATSVEAENEIPSTFALEQNYPNPFNPTTAISYSIVKSSFVSLKVYDMLGREVKTLVNQEMTAGKYNLNWNGNDNFGNTVSSGTYIYRITADNFVSSKKMILIK